MKTIRVVKVSLEAYRKLQELGYTVIFVSTAKKVQ